MRFALFFVLALSAFQAAYGQRTALADTVAKRYANGRISVSEVRSADGIRTLRLFAPNGKLVYEFEDSRMHVICSTQLFYHENGAVERAVTRCHPDGGIQSSETVTQFDSANRPTWRTHQHNERGYGTPSAPGVGEVREYFNAESQWIRQETVECQPVPQQYQVVPSPR